MNNYGRYYFYSGLSGEMDKNPQPGLEKKDSTNDERGQKNEQTNMHENNISFFGLKLSYSKAFGITFLIIFLLLFFPGIGVSSSAAKIMTKADGERDFSSEESENSR